MSEDKDSLIRSDGPIDLDKINTTKVGTTDEKPNAMNGIDPTKRHISFKKVSTKAKKAFSFLF